MLDQLISSGVETRPKAIVSAPITGRGSWSVRYPAWNGPGFGLVVRGKIWHQAGDAPARIIQRGQLSFFSSSPCTVLASEPGLAPQAGIRSVAGSHFGDDDSGTKCASDCEILAGAFQLDGALSSILPVLLPPRIDIMADADSEDSASRLVGLILIESERRLAGSEILIRSLLELLFMTILRQIPTSDSTSGIVPAIADPFLAPALRAMHENAGILWTVKDLAKQCGISRSAFSKRFGETLGCPPIEYLTRWRIALAQAALSRGETRLERLAETLGYGSASALSSAFRRHIGCSPKAFARGQV